MQAILEASSGQYGTTSKERDSSEHAGQVSCEKAQGFDGQDGRDGMDWNRWQLSIENQHRAKLEQQPVSRMTLNTGSSPCTFLSVLANSVRLSNVPRPSTHKLLETRAPLWNTTTHYVYCNKLPSNKIDDVHTRGDGGGEVGFFPTMKMPMDLLPS